VNATVKSGSHCRPVRFAEWLCGDTTIGDTFQDCFSSKVYFVPTPSLDYYSDTVSTSLYSFRATVCVSHAFVQDAFCSSCNWANICVSYSAFLCSFDTKVCGELLVCPFGVGGLPPSRPFARQARVFLSDRFFPPRRPSAAAWMFFRISSGQYNRNGSVVKSNQKW